METITVLLQKCPFQTGTKWRLADSMTIQCLPLSNVEKSKYRIGMQHLKCSPLSYPIIYLIIQCGQNPGPQTSYTRFLAAKVMA